MNKIMHISFFIVLNLVFSLSLWSKDIYTSNLNVKNLTPYEIELSWKANVQDSSFSIFRSVKAMSSPEDLENATNIWVQTVSGTNSGSLFKFPSVIDRPSTSGDYYYIVLPTVRKNKYKKSDFKANINLTSWPTTVKIPEVETNNTITPTNTLVVETNVSSNKTVNTSPQIKVTNTVTIEKTNPDLTNIVTVIVKAEKKEVPTNTIVLVLTNVKVIKKTNKTVVVKPVIEEKYLPLSIKKLEVRRKSNSFFLIWKLNRNVEEDVQFLIYKDNKVIDSVKGRTPYKVIENELFYEDYALDLGKKYYYAVILAGNPVIKSGKNMNIAPVSFGTKEVDIQVEQEVYYEKITLADLKTNENIILQKKVLVENDRNIASKKLVKNNSSVTIEDKKKEINTEDSWNDLQGEEKPSYLLLNKGMSGKNKKVEKEKQALLDKKLEEKRQKELEKERLEQLRLKEIEEKRKQALLSKNNKNMPEKYVTREILVTNYVEILTPIYVTNEQQLQKKQKELMTKNMDNQKERVKIKKKVVKPIVKEQKEIKVEEKEYDVVSEKFLSDKYSISPVKTKKMISDPYALQKGQAAFNNKEYKQTIQLLAEEKEWQALLLKGKSYYFLGEYKLALKYFKALRPVKADTANLWIKMTMNRWGENQ